MGEAAENLNSTETALLEAFKAYEHFSKCLLDAYAVVDATGKVIKCNALLASLVGVRTKQIMKADSLDSLLKLSVAGNTLTVAKLTTEAGPTRVDEVTGTVPGEGAPKTLNLIIGIYPFHHESTNLGAFVLLRDVTAETNLQDKYKDKATQSITDNLTGLFNRAYFSEYLASQVKTLESFPENAPQRTMSVVMLDIDFFKKINDKYGHQAGDYVLRNTGELMKKCFRKTDIVARYGGEEFLAILPGTDLLGAAIAADKLRHAIETFVFDFEGTIIPVTLSSGVALIDIGKETGEAAIARADAALYFSKQNGRNRVSINDGSGPAPLPAPHAPMLVPTPKD